MTRTNTTFAVLIWYAARFTILNLKNMYIRWQH